MKTVPPGCEAVEFGRHTYVCDQGKATGEGSARRRVGHPAATSAAIRRYKRRAESVGATPAFDPFRS